MSEATKTAIDQLEQVLKKRRIHMLIFVPEGLRKSRQIPVDLHDKWVMKLLKMCAKSFGGATAYGRGVGAWKSGQKTYWDRITVLELWIDPSIKRLANRMDRLFSKLQVMCKDLNQDQIGVILNGNWKAVRSE